jgi:hypothetical protein
MIMKISMIIPLALAFSLLTLSSSAIAVSSDDLTVIGISTTDGSSIKLGIEPGQQQQISFSNVTWYIYGFGEVTESIDGNVTATHQVDGFLIIQSRYEAGRHVVSFSSNGSTQKFILTISESASGIDWDELTGKKPTVTEQKHSELYVWAVSILFFLIPLPFVYRRVRRLKRSEVIRIV